MPTDGLNQWAAWFAQRGAEYDFFAHLSQTCEMRHALFFGQPAFMYPALYRRKLCGGSYLETVHDVCELPYAPIGANFFPTDEEVARAQQDQAEKIRKGRDGPVIGWVCSGTRIDKRHPRAGYAVARLIRELGATVIVFGGWEKDRMIASEIETQVKHANGGIYGQIPGLVIAISPSKDEDTWPIRRSLAQLQQCDLVVTPDTGPWWAVMSRPMPKILMVSHASAENIGKHGVNTTVLHANVERVECWPCHRLHDDNTYCKANPENDGPACMSDISVEAIVRAAGLWLGDRGRAKQTIAGPMTPDALLAAVAERPITTLPAAPVPLEPMVPRRECLIDYRPAA